MKNQLSWIKAQFEPSKGLILPLAVIVLNPIRRISKFPLNLLVRLWVGRDAINSNSERYQAIDTRLTDAVMLFLLGMSGFLLNFASLGSFSTVGGSVFFHTWFAMRILSTISHTFMNGLLIGNRTTHGPNPTLVYSKERTVLLGFVNYVEVIMLFACLYLTHSEWFRQPSQDFSKGINSATDAIYFSGVTQLTVGYGDISPVDQTARHFVLLQALLGLVLLLVLVGRFMSSLTSVGELNSGKKP